LLKLHLSNKKNPSGTELSTHKNTTNSIEYPPEDVRIYITLKDGASCYGSYGNNKNRQQLPRWSNEFGQPLERQNINGWKIAQFTIKFRYKGNFKNIIYSSSTLSADSEIKAENIMIKIAKTQSLQLFEILKEGQYIERIAS